jgi:hypothetical protein
VSVNEPDLEQRVRALEQIELARGHLHGYAAVLDDPDPEAVALLFRQDAELRTPSTTVQGRDAIREFYARAFASDPSVKRHFLTMPRATWLDQGRVRLECYFQFVGRHPEDSVLGWGTYDLVVDVSSRPALFASLAIAPQMRTTLVGGWAG